MERFKFQYKGIFLRPAASSIELFEEGKEQDHCIGGYAKNYANGFCNVFFVRRVEEPDKPFYTMSVVGKKVSQCRGSDNCDMTPEVRKFVDMFIQKKLLPKKRTRIDITGIAPERQEAII